MAQNTERLKGQGHTSRVIRKGHLFVLSELRPAIAE